MPCPDGSASRALAALFNVPGVTAKRCHHELQRWLGWTRTLLRQPRQFRRAASNRDAPFELNSVAIFGSQTQTLGNLFNGNESSARIDFNANPSNRLFLHVQLVEVH